MATDSTSRFPRGDPKIPYDIATDRLAAQLAQIDGLDAKLANAFGFGSALFAVALAVLALRDADIPRATVGLLSASGAVYLALGTISLIGYRIRDWEFGPRLDAVWQLADKHEDAKLGWAVIERIIKDYNANKKHVEQKASLANWTLRLLVLESVLIVIGLLVSLA